MPDSSTAATRIFSQVQDVTFGSSQPPTFGTRQFVKASNDRSFRKTFCAMQLPFSPHQSHQMSQQHSIEVSRNVAGNVTAVRQVVGQKRGSSGTVGRQTVRQTGVSDRQETLSTRKATIVQTKSRQTTSRLDVGDRR